MSIYLHTRFHETCQDLSLAGKRAGMKDTSTRSGLLWEVERILNECENLPQCLIMENVPQIHSKENIKDFCKWIQALENLGYKNYWKDLNAKNYGIPQNRNRTFMVSILGDYNYNFPKKQKLKLRLKDMLEDEVDENYYLSEKMIKYVTQKLDNIEIDDFLVIDSYNKKITNKNISGAIVSGQNRNQGSMIIVPEATKKGYAIAKDGDGIYINRPQQKRGVVQKGMIQTLKTQCDDVAVVLEEEKNLFTEMNVKMITEEGNIKRYLDSEIVDEFKEGQCATLNYPNGYGNGTRVFDNCPTITATSPQTLITKEKQTPLRIRKLTAKECGRLMGLKDEDIDKIAKNQSNASQYHLYGDSIVTTCLMALFGELLGINYIEKINNFNNWWKNE